MRKVKFIKSLNVEDVILFSGQELKVHEFDLNCQQVGDDLFIKPTDFISDRIVPVHRICFADENEQKDVYIAYSKEVEELISVPFSALNEARKTAQTLTADALNQLDSLNRDYHKLQNKIKDASFLDRVKYLFTGEL